MKPILIPCPYSPFWMKFQKVMRELKYACYCHPQTELSLEPVGKIANESIYHLKEPILLRGLPCDTVTGHIDAVINYEERFSSHSPHIPSTTSTSVYYHLRNIQGQRSSLQQLYNLRFEFHPSTGKDDGDPIAHVHVDTKKPDKYPEAYTNAKPVHLDAHKNAFLLFGKNRIPTPLMPLPGVLCLLVAEHYRSGVKKLLSETLDILDSIPTPAQLETWQNNCKQTSTNKGWTWYRY